MGQAGLPELCGPSAVQRVLIGNQDTVPVADELEEGLFASRGIDEEEGRKSGNHDPDVLPDFASGFPESGTFRLTAQVCDTSKHYCCSLQG